MVFQFKYKAFRTPRSRATRYQFAFHSSTILITKEYLKDQGLDWFASNYKWDNHKAAAAFAIKCYNILLATHIEA